MSNLKPAGKVFFAILLVSVLFVAKKCNDVLDGNSWSKRIELSTCSEPIYLNKMVWGITTTNQRITISHSGSSPSIHPDTTSNYSFREDMPFYYRIEGDTLLVIYTPILSSVPPEFECSDYIQQVKITMQTSAKLFRELESLGVTEIE